MATLPLKAQIVREALRGIGQAIEGLSRPTGIIQVIDPGPPMGTAAANPDPDQLPGGTCATYVLGIKDHTRAGVPPRLWPEIIEVTEALMGAAFVVAQEHIGNATIAQVLRYRPRSKLLEAPRRMGRPVAERPSRNVGGHKGSEWWQLSDQVTGGDRRAH